ncbi:MAG: immune inhibitor A [Candidatus Tectomicrobia bacterium]|uniref:Immune inhibitor A n=1 Tax=Tectimicrobiota bacterium TaxID=2528274 RepID=A0A932FW32_UNCTE|nr:immune inhibitor A [Candidatus Tectomicrobia bacterium]
MFKKFLKDEKHQSKTRRSRRRIGMSICRLQRRKGLVTHLKSLCFFAMVMVTLLFMPSTSQGGLVYFSDDFESGMGNWVAPNWGWNLTTSSFHSATHSITDSPNGNYQNSTDNPLTLVNPINLSSSVSPTLTFWHRYNTESVADLAKVEISRDGGLTWSLVVQYSGTSLGWPGWKFVQLNLTSYKSSSVKIRFRLTSDGSVTNDGWYIDDVLIEDSTLPPWPNLSLTLTGCTICQPGNRFTVQAHVTNPGSRDIPVEVKIGVRRPDGVTINVMGDRHMEVTLPAGFDQTVTPIDVSSVPEGLPAGTWTVEGTLLGPDLGETFSRQGKTFEVRP